MAQPDAAPPAPARSRASGSSGAIVLAIIAIVISLAAFWKAPSTSAITTAKQEVVDSATTLVHAATATLDRAIDNTQDGFNKELGNRPTYEEVFGSKGNLPKYALSIESYTDSGTSCASETTWAPIPLAYLILTQGQVFTTPITTDSGDGDCGHYVKLSYQLTNPSAQTVVASQVTPAPPPTPTPAAIAAKDTVSKQPTKEALPDIF